MLVTHKTQYTALSTRKIYIRCPHNRVIPCSTAALENRKVHVQNMWKERGKTECEAGNVENDNNIRKKWKEN